MAMYGPAYDMENDCLNADIKEVVSKENNNHQRPCFINAYDLNNIKKGQRSFTYAEKPKPRKCKKSKRNSVFCLLYTGMGEEILCCFLDQLFFLIQDIY